ncbi:hypothetical protein [Rickettsia massiliae]|uniref:hypothetical protein n=1 Tax=Rickettsia massiliae TaxID=35791 RepID=UPI000312E5EA|nr:hypothetical protein [Rickettsia massiliae]
MLNGANNGLKEEMIINTLKELLSDHSCVMLNLKPSNNEKEFQEKLEKIIYTYEKGKENPEIKKELENLDIWCKETAKKDNLHVFKNIGQIIKHSFKALANIGNKKAFKKEQKEVGIYMDAITHANKNTKQTLERIRATINKHKSPLPHSITYPQEYIAKKQARICRKINNNYSKLLNVSIIVH